MILLDELTHRTTLAGLHTPFHVQLEGPVSEDDLLLYCDPTSPKTGALLYSFEGFRAGEIPLAYVAETGELLRFGGHYGSLSDLSVLWPLTEAECFALDAERALCLATHGGEQGEPDWAPSAPFPPGDAEGSGPLPADPEPVSARLPSDPLEGSALAFLPSTPISDRRP